MSWGRQFVGVAALVVVITTLAVTLNQNDGDAVELVDARETTQQLLHQNEQKLESAEMLAARAQDRLLLKDQRIFNSLKAAAQKHALAAGHEDDKFLQARQTQLVLDERLAKLTHTLQAQEEALAYMRPRLEQRFRDTEMLSGLVGQLDKVVPELTPDLKKVQEQLQNIKDSGKQTKEQILTADEELVKSQNAFRLFGERMQEAREKAAQSRVEVENLNVAALRAQQEATALRQQANSAHSMQEGKFLAAEASQEEARVAMLNKEAQEAMQSTQLHDAEADEATSYMSMFGADAQMAEKRVQAESQKLAALARQYQRGKYLEMSGANRQQFLKGQLERARGELARSMAEDVDDKLAYLTGQKATARTFSDVKVEDGAAFDNTAKARNDIEKMEKDRSKWADDAEQAEAIKTAAIAHEHAAIHLEKAAEMDQ